LLSSLFKFEENEVEAVSYGTPGQSEKIKAGTLKTGKDDRGDN
jgi:hypothetical protein